MITFWEFLEVAGALRSGEVVRTPDLNKLLEQHVAPWTFASFRKMSGKFGINPGYKWGFSPNAMYGYKIKDVINKSASFGSDYPFIVVFTIKESARPYIIDLEEADRMAQYIVAPLLRQFLDDHEQVVDYLYIADLSDEEKQKFSEAFANVLPTLPDFFSKIVNIASNVRLKIGRTGIISRLINRILDVGGPTSVKRSFGTRQLLVSLGMRGYLAGGTDAAKIAKECVFFYPTDAQVLAEYNTQKNLLGYDTATQTTILQQRHGGSLINKIKNDIDYFNVNNDNLQKFEQLLQKCLNFMRQVPDTVWRQAERYIGDLMQILREKGEQLKELKATGANTAACESLVTQLLGLIDR